MIKNQVFTTSENIIKRIKKKTKPKKPKEKNYGYKWLI